MPGLAVARWLAVAAALLTGVPAALARDRPMQQVPLFALGRGLVTDVRVSGSARGMEIPVDGASNLILPLTAVEALELDCVSDGIVNVSWGSDKARRIFGPPWRYTRVPSRGVLVLDLRRSAGWSASSRPLLRFDGTGKVTITALRARALPDDPGAARRTIDRAAFWAPESVGHTTINTLTPPLWSSRPRIYLADIAAVVFVAVALAGFVLVRGDLARRRVQVGFASAALAAAALCDAHLLVRLVPMANLRPLGGPDARIAANFTFAPEFGALTALARETLRAEDRVGVMSQPDDWFSPQTMCLDLAPRRCVRLNPGEQQSTGISGVERLPSNEIDAVVSFHSDDVLPDGFVRVAQVTPRAFIARRP